MKRAGAALTLLGVALVLLGALSSATANAAITTPAGTFSGEGESWPLLTVKKLETDATTANAADFGSINATYLGTNGTGEDGAHGDFVGGTTDFGVTEKALTTAESGTATTNGITPAYVPYALGAVDVVVAISFKPPGGQEGLITGMRLKMATIAKIFAGSITNWDDGEILAENPSLAGPLSQLVSGARPIQRVVRVDSSATTTALVAAFLADATAASSWKGYAHVQGISQTAPPNQWPSDSSATITGEVGGSQVVVDDMLNLDPHTQQKLPDQVEHSIGYLGPGWAALNTIPVVAVQNLAGQNFVMPTAAAVNSAMASGATFDSTTHLYSISQAPFDYSKMTATDAYPIPLASYLMVPTTGATSLKAKLLSDFVTTALGSTGQADVAATNLIPVSSDVAAAGASVVTALNAEAAATTTTTGASTSSSSSTSTSTSSTTTASSTSTTAHAATTTRQATTTTRATGGTSNTSRSGTNAAAQLAQTGSRAGFLILVAGLVLVTIGDLVRRRARGSMR